MDHQIINHTFFRHHSHNDMSIFFHLRAFIGLARVITAQFHCALSAMLHSVDQQGHHYCSWKKKMRLREQLWQHGLTGGASKVEPIDGGNLRPDGLLQCIVQCTASTALRFEVTWLAFLLQRNVPHKKHYWLLSFVTGHLLYCRNTLGTCKIVVILWCWQLCV